MTENEMVGWHQLNGYEFKQTLGDGEGQGSLVCCSPWGRKELDMTQRLNNKKQETELQDLRTDGLQKRTKQKESRIPLKFLVWATKGQGYHMQGA